MSDRATLPSGEDIAIKRLAITSGQGDEEFRAEVKYLGTLKHRNLVSLLGAYVAAPPSKERLLIYQFLPGMPQVFLFQSFFCLP